VKKRFQSLPFKRNLRRYNMGSMLITDIAAWVGLFTPGVALQVAFERQTLKPVFHLIGYRLWV
jgi:hypothetical protein